jgi:hypothetical protein
MRTADDFDVSGITKMCDHHEQHFAGMAVLVMEEPDDDWPGGASDRLDQIREYLAEGREVCLRDCGRMEEL